MREIGADQCVETGQPVLSSISKESIDVVIDVVGGPQWPDLLDVLRPRGRYAVSGAIAGPIVELDLRKLYLKDLTFFGCTAQAPEVFPAIISYLERGEIVPLVSKTYPLQDIAQAQEEFLSKRQIGKIVLIPPQP
jgi:NADPH:quinone reductase-like Zn-dependent oxidoreductase